MPELETRRTWNEMVLWTVRQQFYLAKAFRHEMNGIRRRGENLPPNPELPWWNGLPSWLLRIFKRKKTPVQPQLFPLRYGFYDVMGELVVDTSDSTIEDKSKADHYTKDIVILQVSWMFLQCITRYIQELPVSTLEMHTLVHAVCAIFMYLFWWCKPLNIRDPTVLDTGDYRLKDELALELRRSMPFPREHLRTRCRPR